MVWTILDLSTSIWLHSMIVFGLIPSLVAVRARRAVIPFVSEKFAPDTLAMIVWVAGLLVTNQFQPGIQGVISSVFYSAMPDSLNGANVVMMLLEIIGFHKLVLGRRIFT